jgi:hypothetical protein
MFVRSSLHATIAMLIVGFQDPHRFDRRFRDTRGTRLGSIALLEPNDTLSEQRAKP